MGGIGQWIYFRIIFAYLDKEIEIMRTHLIGGLIQWILLFGSILITSWIIFQGWLVVTGRSRAPMMALVTQSMRVGLITLAATTFTFVGHDVSTVLTDTVPRAITGIVTGDEESPATKIDQGLALMQGTFAVVDAVGESTGGGDGFKDQLASVSTMSAVGTAGPAVVGGALLLMYKVGLGLFVGLGPLFIMCLMFQATRPLFSKWLHYGVGTMFSLAVLCFMVTVAMKLVLAAGALMIVKYKLAMASAGAGEGLSSIAMQQGGLGLILTILLVTCPPMAAQFFQGTIGGAFSQYSAFGNTGRGASVRDSAGNVTNHGTRLPSNRAQAPGRDVEQKVPIYGLNRHALANQGANRADKDEIRQASRSGDARLGSV